uniref:Uncharacterized protein n=1 Tax=CrAss-like virus sp. ctXt06 TaxID=2825837 RepID=A0A8S5V783_9CAUD|nr:MAG TPA: hypothetical protein [CrAss-like virus sp. ctXt06]
MSLLDTFVSVPLMLVIVLGVFHILELLKMLII